jgi:hypothetical protein
VNIDIHNFQFWDNHYGISPRNNFRDAVEGLRAPVYEAGMQGNATAVRLWGQLLRESVRAAGHEVLGNQRANTAVRIMKEIEKTEILQDFFREK